MACEDVTHRDELEAMLAALRTAVDLEMPLGFTDSAMGAELERCALLAHFGELAEPIAEWDGALERMSAAPAALWEWLGAAVAERGVTEPPVALGSLIDRLAFITLERSRRGLLRVPHALYLQELPSRLRGEDVISLYVEGQQVATVSAKRTAETKLQLGALGRIIQELFDDAAASDQARALDEARDSLLMLKQRLLSALRDCGPASPLRLAPACPVCQQAAAQRAS